VDNQNGTTTEETPVSLADQLYGSKVDEPEADNVEAPEVEEPAEKVIEAESTEEVDSVSEPEKAESEEQEAEVAEVDDSEVFVTEDGEEVTLKTLLDAHKGRKAAQADYTKKTTAASEEMKRATALKAEVEAARESIAPRVQLFNEIESELGQLIMGDFAQIDWNTLRDTDPSQYLALKEAKEQREQAMNQLKAKRNQVIAQQSQEEAVKLHELLGWSDPVKRATDVKSISEGVKTAGVPDTAFAQVTNSALMSLIYDGIKHRQLQDKKPAIMRKIKSAPKVISKPSKPVRSVEEPLSLADRMYRKQS